jgi:hypothetical protein
MQREARRNMAGCVSGMPPFTQPQSKRGHEPGANSRALDQKPVFLGFSEAEND